MTNKCINEGVIAVGLWIYEYMNTLSQCIMKINGLVNNDIARAGQWQAKLEERFAQNGHAACMLLKRQYRHDQHDMESECYF